MKKKKTIQLIAIIIFLVITLLFVQSVSALTANCSSYSVNMFGTGMATGTPSSTNYNSTFLSTAQGTTRNADSNSYRVNIGFFDNTIYHRIVSITSYSISPASAVVGSTIGLSISALNAQAVWAKVVAPNAQQQTINLVNNEFITYAPPSIVGRYNVTFYANSSTGAIASVVDYFELTAQITPPPSGGSPSGGGGSTTTIIEKTCNYIWDCTPWSLCRDGKQTRECKMIGECEGIEVEKPKEEIQCFDALFDITLKLGSIELTQNMYLIFNINLTETIGKEKIDVHIKYTIINKNNEEIFSQIETRAVEKNLFYSKKIDDIQLVDGEYTLRVDILYGNLQRAFAEQNIKISNGKIETGESISDIQNIIEIETGKSTSNIQINWFVLSAFIFIIAIILLVFIKRKKIMGIIENIKEKIRKKYPCNSVRGLIGKKVYTDSGDYVGEIKDIILDENKIDSLKIKLDEKQFSTKGIILKWNYIVSCGEIITIDSKVLDDPTLIFSLWST